ncbi:MAG: 5'/3'-nucleotidase SurE [Acidimicrobiaceae bacterium]|nr:5'/3'-nucleotidase SurE [Acidimicrobiaceae bacterium]
MRILVTNDDGIDSLGLLVLARALQDLGDVVIVAPDTEYSGASASVGALQRMQPEVHRQRLDGIDEAWAVTGPPALCVMFARLGAFGPPFDLVVAGINPGANVGRAVYHSGTVGAALTARLGGVSGVAVSQAVKDFGVEGQGWDEMLEDQQWETAASVARSVVGAVLAQLPEDPIVLNVNVPNVKLSDVRGWRSTPLGLIPPRTMGSVTLEDKAGHPGSYHVRLTWGDPVELPEKTDGGAIQRGLIAVTLLGSLGEHAVDPGSPVGHALDQLLA